jgi:hypothetical protein
MVRVVAAVMLLLLAGPALGLGALLDEACLEDCGGTDERCPCCPVSLASCLCTSHAPAVVPAGTAFCLPFSPGSDATALALADAIPQSPDPHEILHVPRRST